MAVFQGCGEGVLESPSEKAVLILLHADRDVARERFEKSGRGGDEFDKRFDEHEEKIGWLFKQ
jgi:hypothetical protein